MIFYLKQVRQASSQRRTRWGFNPVSLPAIVGEQVGLSDVFLPTLLKCFRLLFHEFLENSRSLSQVDHLHENLFQWQAFLNLLIKSSLMICGIQLKLKH